jgi:hypothetical protein
MERSLAFARDPNGRWPPVFGCQRATNDEVGWSGVYMLGRPWLPHAEGQ